MRRWSGSAWAPFITRNASGAALPWPRRVVVELFDHYVSADGLTTNDGSAGSPWPLDYALISGADGAIQPGAEVGVLDTGGVYSAAVGTRWHSEVSGTAEAPIKFRAVPGHLPIIDSLDTSTSLRLLEINGDYTWFWGLVFRFTGSLIRQSSEPAGGDTSNPPDIGGRGGKEVRDQGRGNRLINNIFHDGCNGWTSQNAATCFESQYYGNLSFNNGWVGVDRGHGHGCYTQNMDPLGKEFLDNVYFGNFSTGVKISGSGDAFLKYYTVRGNFSFNNEVYGGGGGDWALHIEGGGNTGSGPHTIEDNVFVSKNGLGGAVKLNVAGNPAMSSVGFERNTVAGDAELNEADAYTVLDNTFTRLQTVANGKRAISLHMDTGQAYDAHTVDRNSVVMPAAKFPYFLTKADGTTSIYNSRTTWNAETGYDANGVFTDAVAPAASEIVYRPNEYETGRGWIYCLNWTGAASLDVDLSQVGLSAGDDYTVHHVYDVFGTPVASGTYDGASALTLGQTGYVHPTPLGWTGAVPDSSAPYFNVFLVRKV